MLRFVSAFACGVLLFAAAPLKAQWPSTAEPEHKLLKKFEGNWDAENKTNPGPGQPEIECKGESTAKMIGDFWIVSSIELDMQGTKITASQTIGYDPEKKKYVGTWVDSMLNHLWKYEGTFDKSGNILVMEAEGPHMLEPGKRASYRDSYEFKSADHIVTTSSMKEENGEWTVFMKGDLKRKK